ncbi:hypothetical protein COHA_003857 [Chlorella ohadii]|uniref:Glycosyltransferase 2-like domain-containing protein n=1 Tax=Chlorella ohadii TaxID=2649997 RepID=A0AAD5DU93_9CHLO|nr:hypothetical protein COHA_003857 [Chlorella ohadii]
MDVHVKFWAPGLDDPTRRSPPPATCPAGPTEITLSLCIGVDEDDALAAEQAALQRCFPGLQAHVTVFPLSELAPLRAGGAPLCWMWGQLASAALREFGSDWTLLIGDDVSLEPADWATRLAEYISAHPHLRCIARLDTADPGFPSFLALHKDHLATFGRLLPPQFDGCNQGGDPFLFELHHRFGTAGLCLRVRISNAIGGMDGSVFGAASQPPRYSKAALGASQWRQLLDEWSKRMAGATGAQPRMQVAVLVPSFRVNPKVLGGILTACRTSFADVDAQLDHLPHLRVRVNGANKGASHSRNRLLEEACGAHYAVFWDDDVEPQPGCLDAYVAAFKAHPDEVAFAGPSVLPRLPDQLLPTAIHMSGVSFFWEAPAAMAPAWGGRVPWAVTANLAVKLSAAARFKEGFPGAGGGEDVDFCLQLGGRMRAVPGAGVVHPWWPEGRPWVYRRFFRWAQGDGWLLDLWPALAYRRAPNLAELLGLMAGCLLPTLLAGAMSVKVAVAAVAGALLADLALFLCYACCSPAQRAQHPCRPDWLRPLAAAEACLISAVSEAGRAWGQMERGHWWRLCASFDWFAGLDAGVVHREQAWAALRCCLTVMGALLLAATVA